MNNIPTYNLLAREFLNGALFPICCFLSWIVGLYLWDTYRAYGQGWNNQPGVRTACAIWWVFTAEAVRAGTVWFLLREQNDLVELSERVRHISGWLILIGGLVLVATLLRCTFLFTPPKWGHRIWIIASLTTIIFLTISHILPYITA
jgi:hypothetical protein